MFDGQRILALGEIELTDSDWDDLEKREQRGELEKR
jgi:hypothetical protein